MPSQRKHSRLFSVVLVPVALIILGAFVLSAASVLENLRFANATAQILNLVRMIRSFVEEQKTFSFSLGEDVWAAMVRVQQIPETTAQKNPWGGAIRATVTAITEISLESNLPSRDCRRMALYFLGSGPAKHNLLSIAARSDQDAAWHVIYPSPADKQTAVVEAACGLTNPSHLALVFNIK